MLERIARVLAVTEAGATMDHVIRTWLFATSMSAWEEIGLVLGSSSRRCRRCVRGCERRVTRGVGGASGVDHSAR